MLLSILEVLFQKKIYLLQNSNNSVFSSLLKKKQYAKKLL